ncbi:hypothetical protein KA005_01200 [bacterium]|nr:hypothetical protein [bacterium]
MALTAKVTRTYVGQQDSLPFVLADSDTYYAGGIVCNSSGKAAFISAVAENQSILGILTGEYDDGDRVDAKVIGASNTVKAVTKRGKIWLPHSGAAITDIGLFFTPDSDNSMDAVPATAAKRYIGYECIGYDSSLGLLFDLRVPVVVDNET